MDILLNWLWRGGVVAGAAHLLIWALGPLSPRTRYRVWWSALLLTVSLPLLPVVNLAWMPEVTPALVARVAPLVSLPDSTARINRGLTVLWLAWIVVIGGRVLFAAAATRSVKRRALPLASSIEGRLNRWMTIRSRGRRAPLMVSSEVRLAAVLGVGSPVIAVAPALIDSLSPDDLDRVVVHEWAHVQRHDDFGNALQLAGRVLVGWHPGAWWIGRQLEMEREIACDEQAIAITGSIKPYATCLATLAALGTRGASLPVPAALTSSRIRRRVTRILALPRAGTAWWSRGAATVSTCALCLLASTLASIDLVDVYAADVVAAIQGRSFTLPNLTAPNIVPLAPADSEAEAPVQTASRNMASTPGVSATSTAQSPVLATLARAESPAQSPGLDAVTVPSAEPQSPPVAPLIATPLPSPPLPPPAGSQAAVPVRPWTAAADAGVAVGAGSQRAAVATAGFFSRFGKSVAGSF